MRIGRVTNLLLLFVHTAGDLGPACQQVGEFLAFCRSRQSGSYADGRFLGAWIDERTVTDLPLEMELRLPTNEVIMLAVREIFSLSGVWAVVSVESVCLETTAGMELSHDMVFDALFAFAQGDTGRVGRYAPAFVCDTSEKQVRAEIKRLNSRYPLRIEKPIYYDPVTGELSLQNEHLRH